MAGELRRASKQSSTWSLTHSTKALRWGTTIHAIFCPVWATVQTWNLTGSPFWRQSALLAMLMIPKGIFWPLLPPEKKKKKSERNGWAAGQCCSSHLPISRDTDLPPGLQSAPGTLSGKDRRCARAWWPSPCSPLHQCPHPADSLQVDKS